MKLSKFNFELPKDIIAQHPTAARDDAKMMVIHRKTGKIVHKKFKDILEYFTEHDVMVLNNTKVFPARLYGRKEKTGAKIEVFMLRELNREMHLWDVLVDPARKIRVGNKLYFGDDDMLVAEVVDNTTSRGRTIRFLHDGSAEELRRILDIMGETPLPKYIKRKPDEDDKERYQTVFAKHEGAVAAPTAGMHFSRELLKRLEIKGVEFAEITLHVGLGNFRTVDVEDLTKHKMDSEQVIIDETAARIVNTAKDGKKNICAVGTSSLRAIETSVSIGKQLKPYNAWTNIFIFPPHEFSIANSLVTNLHLPQSTLMMTVAAFAGYDFLMKAYKVAVEEKYKFFSYGDAMLVLPD